MSKKPPPEKLTVRINSADGNSMTFTATGSVVGGMVEVMSWLPAERRVKVLERCQAMHEQRLKVEAERASVIAAAEGWAMVRYTGCEPFVVREREIEMCEQGVQRRLKP